MTNAHTLAAIGSTRDRFFSEELLDERRQPRLVPVVIADHDQTDFPLTIDQVNLRDAADAIRVAA